MNVLVPYVRLSPYTKAALEEDGRHPVYVMTPGPLGYIDALETAWNTGEGFIVVEQDKVPWQGALRQLEECPEDWCVFPARMHQTNQPAEFPTLSTAKFSTRFVRDFPRFMRAVRNTSVGSQPAGHYSRLDMAIYDQASRCRIPPHWHEPEVLHRHEGEDD